MNERYFQAMFLIIRKGHWITEQLNKELKKAGVTEPQYNVLKILAAANGKPLDVQTVQKGMVQRTSNVTRIVDKLQTKGFVNRTECPTNRRKMDLTITEAGKARLAELDKIVIGFHQPLMNNLNDTELETLKALLEKFAKID